MAMWEESGGRLASDMASEKTMVAWGLGDLGIRVLDFEGAFRRVRLIRHVNGSTRPEIDL